LKFWKLFTFGSESRNVFQHCELGHFPTIWLISLERKNQIFMHENFIIDVYLDKEVLNKFWKSSGSRLDVARGRSALSECLCSEHLMTYNHVYLMTLLNFLNSTLFLTVNINCHCHILY